MKNTYLSSDFLYKNAFVDTTRTYSMLRVGFWFHFLASLICWNKKKYCGQTLQTQIVFSEFSLHNVCSLPKLLHCLLVAITIHYNRSQILSKSIKQCNSTCTSSCKHLRSYQYTVRKLNAEFGKCFKSLSNLLFRIPLLRLWHVYHPRQTGYNQPNKD